MPTIEDNDPRDMKLRYVMKDLTLDEMKFIMKAFDCYTDHHDFHETWEADLILSVADAIEGTKEWHE